MYNMSKLFATKGAFPMKTLADLDLAFARIYGPAFALIRAQFEAFVRGTWLRLCATPAELKRFTDSDKIKQEFWELIDAIEAHPEFADQVLSGVGVAPTHRTVCGSRLMSRVQS